MKKQLLFLFLLVHSLLSYPALFVNGKISYAPPCIQADTPTLSLSSGTVCSGSTCTISIAPGNQLNNAAKWYLYEGSCGGTRSDSSSTGTFILTPSLSTTYFVRGEGGCTTPGSCGSIAIVVVTTPTVQANASASTICQGDSIRLYGNGASSYVWSNAVSNNSYFIPNNTATFTVTGTTSGCAANAVVSLTVNPRPAAPIITSTSAAPLCTGDSIQLSFPNSPGNSYNWYNASPTAGWNVVGTTGFSQRAASYQSLAFHPATSEPYVAYMDVPNGNKTTVKKFNGISWEVVGNTGFSDGVSTYQSLAFHPLTHEPYVAFADASVGGKLRVMKFNGTFWENVGDAGYSLGKASFIKLVFNPQTNQPMVAYADNLLWEKIVVLTFTGSFWDVVGYYGFSDDKVTFIDLAIHPTTFEPYVIYCDLSIGYKNIIKKFNGTTWQSVAAPATGTGAVGENCIAFHPVTQELYIAYQDNSANAYKATVKKLNGSTLTNVGPVAFSPGFASWLSLAFNPASNEPYLAFSDNSNSSKATVMRFNGSAWQTVGAAGVSPGATKYNSLKFQPSTNEPYLAYSSTPDTSKVAVLKYTVSGGSNSAHNPITVNQAGTFGAVVTNTYGCSSKSANEIVINSTPLVKANASKTMLCQGEPVKLIAGGTAQNYNWNHSVTNNSAFIPVTSAYYVLTVSNASGCTHSDSVFLTVNPSPVALATPGGTLDLCLGDTLSTSLFNGNTYCWNSVSSMGWQNVGIPGFSSSNAYYQGMAIHPLTHEPYVAFTDLSNSSKTTVMKFNGSSWQTVGLPGFTNYYTYTNGIVFHPVTREPYVVISGDNYYIDVLRFNGTAWVNLGPTNTTQGMNPQLIFNPVTNEPYLIARSSLNGMPIFVQRFDGSGWQPVGNSTALNTTYFGGSQSMAFHPTTNELYIAFSGYTGGPTTQFGVFVKKLYNSNWITSNSTNLQTCDYPSLFFHPQTHEPYLAMLQAGKVCVMKQTTIWQYVGNPNLSNGAVGAHVMKFNPLTNEPYVSYVDAANKITVKKFNGSSWLTVGNPSFTSSNNTYLDMALHPANGNPYVTYCDNTVGNKATTKSFSSQCAGVLNTFPVNQSGTYATVVTNAFGCTDTSNHVTVTIHALPTLTVTVAPSATLCSGEALTLTANGTGTLSWNNGVSNGVSTVPASSASYVASVTNSYGCIKTQTVNVQVNPKYQIVQNKLFCSNYLYTLPGGTTTSASGTYTDVLNTIHGCDSVIVSNLTFTNTLQGPGTTASICHGSSYLLPSGANATLQGIYSDTLNSSAGCDSVVIINLTVNTVNTSVTLNTSILSAQIANATYQWLNCNSGMSAIPGATTQSYTATASGNYAVVITQNGCSDTSACVPVTITITGLQEGDNEPNDQLLIYPNPANRFIVIQSKGALLENATFTLLNELGQSIEVITLHNTSKHVINSEHLSNGIYFIVGFHNGHLTKQKIVITR